MAHRFERGDVVTLKGRESGVRRGTVLGYTAIPDYNFVVVEWDDGSIVGEVETYDDSMIQCVDDTSMGYVFGSADLERINRALVDYTIALNSEIDNDTDKAEWAKVELDEVAELAQRLGLEG